MSPALMHWQPPAVSAKQHGYPVQAATIGPASGSACEHGVPAGTGRHVHSSLAIASPVQPVVLSVSLLQHIVVPPSVAEPLSAAEPLSPLELPLEPLLEPLLDPPLELPPESLSGDPLSCGSLFDELLLEQPAETPATIAR